MTFIDWLKQNMPDAVTYSARKELAKQAGIENYKGDASQNMKLWDYLKKQKASKPKEMKTSDDVTAYVQQLGYIPDDLLEKMEGLVNMEAIGNLPFESDYKSSQPKTRIVKKTVIKEDPQHVLQIKNYVLSPDLGTITSGYVTDDVWNYIYPKLTSEEQRIARKKYQRHSDPERLYAGSQQADEDEYAGEVKNIERLQEIGTKNFPLAIRTLAIRPGEHFMDDVKAWLKKHHLTDDVIMNLLNSTGAEQKFATDANEWGKWERKRKDADGKQIMKDVANARNEFADKAMNLINAPSSLIWGTVDYLKNDEKYTNKSLKNYLESMPHRLLEHPVYATDVLGSTGNLYGDMAVDMLLDPLSVGSLIANGRALFKNGIALTRQNLRYISNTPKGPRSRATSVTSTRPEQLEVVPIQVTTSPHSGGGPRVTSKVTIHGLNVGPTIDLSKLAKASKKLLPYHWQPGNVPYSKGRMRVYRPDGPFYYADRPNYVFDANDIDHYLNYQKLYGLNKKRPGFPEGVLLEAYLKPIIPPGIISNLDFPQLSSDASLNVEYPTYEPQHNEMEYQYVVNPEFEKAFAEARKKGLTEFEFKGRKYGTNLDPNYNKRSVKTTWNPLLSLTPELGNVLPVEPVQGTIIDGTQVMGTIPIAGPGHVVGSYDYTTLYPRSLTVDQISYRAKGGELSYIDLF